MSDVTNFPVSSNLSASDLLMAAAKREFKEVLILGWNVDGDFKHATTLTRGQDLHLMECYRLKTMGVVDSFSIDEPQ